MADPVQPLCGRHAAPILPLVFPGLLRGWGATVEGAR